MLVLNSNTATGGNALTNQNVMINYPDIENSILLFPDRRYASYGTVATINGLTINMMGGEASKDNMFNLVRPITTSATFDKNFPPYVGGMGSTNNPIRLTTPLPIDQLVGQVIGKKIVLPDLIGNGSNPSMQIGILHSDGTISFFHDSSIGYSYIFDIQPGRYGYISSTNNYRGTRQASAGSGNNYHMYVYVPTTKVIETNGIVVQQGDRPIAVMNWSSSYVVAFGGFIPTTQDERLKPIQISID